MTGEYVVARAERFRLGAGVVKRSHVTGLVIGGVLLTLASLGAVLYSVATQVQPPRAWHRLLEELVESAAHDPDLVLAGWLSLFAVPLAVLIALLHRRAWLKADAGGIEFYIPRALGLGWFRQSVGRRKVHWGEVRGVRWVYPRAGLPAARQLGQLRLVIDTQRGEIWLAPFVWLSRNHPDHRLGLPEVFRRSRLNIERLAARAPLINTLVAYGHTPEAGGEPAATPPAGGFDLRTHRGLMWQMAVLFGAGGYALIDAFFTGRFRALEPIPWEPFIAAALLGGVWVFRSGRGAPFAERAGVGLITVIVFTLAVHPAVLRVNALTATTEQVDYIAASPGHFLPPEERWPELQLRDLDIAEYWAGVPEGKAHPFALQKGIGGFYQLDLAPLFERTRDFYRRENSGAG